MSLNDWTISASRLLIGWNGSRVIVLGQYSIRIDDQWRVCFRWQEDDAHDVEVTDYH